MKKLLACLLVLALLIATFCCAVADDSDDWEYRILADGTAEITYYPNLEATSVQIPETLNGTKVTNIAGGAFRSCINNSSFEVSPDHPIFAVIDGVLFSKPDKRIISYPLAKEGDTYAIPQGTEIIGNAAFYCCVSLTSISIPDSVTSIETMAFFACSSLTSISIPDSVTSIGVWAFDECPKLTLTVGRNSYAEQYAKENNIPYTVQDTTENNASYAMPDDSDDWEYRILADGTAEITEYSNPNATNVQIPEALNGMKVTDVAENAFLLCLNNSSFVVSPDHPTLAVIDGVLFSKPDKRLISYPKAKEGDTYAIPQGIEIIGYQAFSYCTSLSNIAIPDSVTSIGDNAFTMCSSLTSISIPNSVTSIGNEAFSYCSSLTSISIPDSVTRIRVGAFANCSSLTSISIPDGVTSIKYATFADCISLTSISIPDSVTRISDAAFNNCPNLTLTVGRDSYAEQYAKNHNISYTYKDANDWLTK